MREIIIDTETTGLNYRGGDRIIEVGCVELNNHISTGKNLQFYCNVDKKIDQSALDVHGISNEFLKKQQTFEQQVKKFLEFIKKDTLIIHNADFDVGFINNELKLLGIGAIKNPIIDTVALARKKLNTRIVNLDSLCRRFSIDLSSRKLHGALLDCQLLAEVYLELMGGKQASLELMQAQTSEKSSKLNKNLNKAEKTNKININEDEIKAHKEFVKDIKNALWQKLDY